MMKDDNTAGRGAKVADRERWGNGPLTESQVQELRASVEVQGDLSRVDEKMRDELEILKRQLGGEGTWEARGFILLNFGIRGIVYDWDDKWIDAFKKPRRTSPA